MFPQELEYCMRLIAKEVVRFPNMSVATIKTSSKTGNKFIRIITKNSKAYGLSYLKATKSFEIWDRYGEFASHDDQLHLSFDSLTDLLLWLKTNDIDTIAEGLQKKKAEKEAEILDTSWEEDQRELCELGSDYDEDMADAYDCVAYDGGGFPFI